MTNFIKKFVLEGLKGLQGENQLSAGVKGVSKFSNIMAQLRADLFAREQIGAELIPSLINSLDFPLLDSVTNLDAASIQDVVTEVSEDYYNQLSNAVYEVKNFSYQLGDISSSEAANNMINITDSLGQCYKLALCNVQISENRNDTYTVLISNVDPAEVNSLFDAIIYKDSNNKYYFNHRFVPINYERTVTPQTKQNIQDAVSYLATLLGVYRPEMLTQGLNDQLLMIMRSVGLQGIHISIESKLKSISNKYGYAYDDTKDILYSINSLCARICGEDSGEGLVHTRFSGNIISDLATSDTINNILDIAANMVSKASFSISDFTAMCNQLVVDASSSVRTIINGVISCYHSGGLYAIAQYVLSIINKTHGITVENGVLTFVNNDDYITSDYLSGILVTVGQTVMDIATKVLESYKVLSLVTTLGSFIFNTIKRGLEYDYNEQTLAKVNDEMGIDILPVAPYALWQGEVPMTYFEGVSILDNNAIHALDDGGVHYVSVPGGLGLFSFNSDKTAVRYEFHPYICEYNREKLWKELNLVSDYRNRVVSSGNNSTVIKNIFLRSRTGASSISLNKQMIYELSLTATPISYSCDVNGISTEDSDAKLRAAVAESSSIFYLYYSLNDDQSISLDCSVTTNVISLGHVEYTYNSQTGVIDMDSVKICRVSDADPGIVGQYMRNLIGYMPLFIISSAYFNPSVYASFDSRLSYLSGLSDTSVLWSRLSSDIAQSSKANSISVNATKLIINAANVYDVSGTLLYHLTFNWLSYGTRNLTLLKVLGRNQYFGRLQCLESDYLFQIEIPKYERYTFMRDVLVFSIMTTVATVTIIGVTLKVRSIIKSERAKSQAKVEAAWYAATDDPTDENIKEYRKQAWIANLKSLIIGGTKYSTTNYWEYGTWSEWIDGEWLSEYVNEAKAEFAETGDPIAQTEQPNVYAYLQHISKSLNNTLLNE